MSTPKERKATIRRVIDETLHQGNLDALDALYADDFYRRRPPYPDIDGLQALRQNFADIRSSYPDVHVTIDEIIIEGDTSVWRWTFWGTQTGASPTTGAPPTGKRVTFTGCTVAHWKYGKIVDDFQNADWLGLLQQLGYEIAPP
ncbi:MAG: ester cyclase [Chloroflexi bacterium]|nr:ester cyclase [Chloroflexota bacterium]